MSFLLQGGLGDTVDFAFIDADKANYSGYIQLCHKLLRPGGLLALDNTLFRVGLIYLYILYIGFILQSAIKSISPTS